MFWYGCRRIQYTPSPSIEIILPVKLFVLFVYPLRGGGTIGSLPLRVIALSRTIGEYRWQDPSQEIMRQAVAINDRSTISYCARRPIVRSIVASGDRSYAQSHPVAEHTYDQSLHPATGRTCNRDGRQPMVRPTVAYCDRSYEQSQHIVTERTINRGMRRPMVR